MDLTLVCADGFTYHKLTDVPLEELGARLKDWVEAQPPPAPSEMPVAWQQLSIVFCEARKQPQLSVHSILRFRSGGNLSIAIPQRESEMLFEHLLFVEYSLQFQQLAIYGSLSHAQYRSIIEEFSFLTVGDVCRVPLLYDIGEQRAELLPALRELRSDYTMESERDYSLDEFVTATDRICQDVIKLNVSTEHSSFYDIATALSNRPHEALGQRGAELIAAMHPPFREALLKHRRTLLQCRLNLGYVFEAHRCFFANTWFPGHFTFYVNTVAQMVCFPGSRQLIAPEMTTRENAEVLEQRAEAVRRWHTARRPDKPYPGVLLGAPAQFLPSTLSGELPRHQKHVLFTHYELEEYLSNYLEFQLTEAVGALQQDTGAALARPIWSRVERRDNLYRTSHRVQVRETLSAHARRPVSDADITEVLQERDSFRYLFDDEEFDQAFLEGYALPFVASVLDGQFLGHPEWEQEPLLQQARHEPSDATVRVDEGELPRTYNELLDYARTHWPPCATRLVEQCHGEHHLKYRQRLIMAALIRKFGYSPEAGAHLWTVLFSETTVAQRATGPFLETEQGRVIGDDYRHDHRENLGISCASMCAASLCPYGRSGTPDIEECQRRCTVELGHKRAFNFRYPIRSPVEYHSLSLRYQSNKPRA